VNKKKFLLPLWTFLFFIGFFYAFDAQSKDLHARLGLGYNRQFANNLVDGATPALSLKYGLTKDIAMSLIAGVKTGSPTNSTFGTKFFKNIFYENNLNFYFMLGLGLVSGAGHSGFEGMSGFGAEFFIPGIESLGFSFETGASIHTITGSTVLRTLGLSFVDAGIHFYF